MQSSKFFILFLILLLFGCAGSRKEGEEILVETSGKKPKWAKQDKEYWVEKGIMYFREMLNYRKDLAFAKREAKAEAIKNVAEKINIRVQTEFKKAAEGSNIPDETLTRFASDAVAWISGNLNIQGISPSRSYWEKYKKITRTGVTYFYNLQMLAEIPERDYFKARDLAIQKVLDKYKEENNQNVRKAAEEIQKRLFQNK